MDACQRQAAGALSGRIGTSTTSSIEGVNAQLTMSSARQPRSALTTGGSNAEPFGLTVYGKQHSDLEAEVRRATSAIAQILSQRHRVGVGIRTVLALAPTLPVPALRSATIRHSRCHPPLVLVQRRDFWFNCQFWCKARQGRRGYAKVSLRWGEGVGITAPCRSGGLSGARAHVSETVARAADLIREGPDLVGGFDALGLDAA